MRYGKIANQASEKLMIGLPLLHPVERLLNSSFLLVHQVGLTRPRVIALFNFINFGLCSQAITSCLLDIHTVSVLLLTFLLTGDHIRYPPPRSLSRLLPEQTRKRTRPSASGLPRLLELASNFEVGFAEEPPDNGYLLHSWSTG